jgi:hypothetical protein
VREHRRRLRQGPRRVDPAAARDVALAEFSALRAEITNRMATTAALVGVGLTALGVIVGFVVKEQGDKRLLLIVPPLALLVNLLSAVENRQVGLIGLYIGGSLWPYLAEQTDNRLPSWEEECAKRRAGARNIALSLLFDYVMTLVMAAAAFTSLAIVGSSVKMGQHKTNIDPMLRAFEWILAVLALAVPIAMTLMTYWRSKGEREAPKPQ